MEEVIFIEKNHVKCPDIMKYEYNLKSVGLPEQNLGRNGEIRMDGKMEWFQNFY